MALPDYQARIGTTLRGKWRLERLLGVGGMAAVYAGSHKIGRQAAIKILHPEVAFDAKIRERFEQEAQAVNSIGHAGVVEILDIDEAEDGSAFLVMELLVGETLADLVERVGTLEAKALLPLVDQTLDVLVACHKKGIIHRDIKPENLFIERSGKLRVLDFGIARVREGVRTVAGTMLGTVAFMPPEQLKGADVDARADLFAVGATMFTVLTGRRVQLAKNDTELAMRMLTKAAPPLASVMGDPNENLALVVDRALAYLPERRYPDAQTMRGDVWALERNGRPPYANACKQAGMDPHLLELPPEPAAADPTPSASRELPATDPQLPAFAASPLPPTAPQLPAFAEASEPPLPSTRPEMPAFAEQEGAGAGEGADEDADEDAGAGEGADEGAGAGEAESASGSRGGVYPRPQREAAGADAGADAGEAESASGSRGGVYPRPQREAAGAGAGADAGEDAGAGADAGEDAGAGAGEGAGEAESASGSRGGVYPRPQREAAGEDEAESEASREDEEESAADGRQRQRTDRGWPAAPARAPGPALGAGVGVPRAGEADEGAADHATPQSPSEPPSSASGDDEGASEPPSRASGDDEGDERRTSEPASEREAEGSEPPPSSAEAVRRAKAAPTAVAPRARGPLSALLLFLLGVAAVLAVAWALGLLPT